MSIEKAPAVKAPWPPKRSNDKFFRYPKPYPVGKEKGESFVTIGKKHSINGAELVQYNFLTRDSSEVNWYLANYSYSGSGILGIVIADQGYQDGDPLAKGEYSYWVGANLIAEKK